MASKSESEDRESIIITVAIILIASGCIICNLGLILHFSMAIQLIGIALLVAGLVLFIIGKLTGRKRKSEKKESHISSSRFPKF